LANRGKITTDDRKPELKWSDPWLFRGAAARLIDHHSRLKDDEPNACRLRGQVELIHFRDEDDYMIRVDLTDRCGWDSCVRGDFNVQSRTRVVPIEALHAIPVLFGAPE
jgi:hypothetical protein